jgi:hypothetical protein
MLDIRKDFQQLQHRFWFQWMNCLLFLRVELKLLEGAPLSLLLCEVAPVPLALSHIEDSHVRVGQPQNTSKAESPSYQLTRNLRNTHCNSLFAILLPFLAPFGM